MKKYLALPSIAAGLLLCAMSASWAGEPDAAKLEKGKTLFKTGAVPACAVCHALQDAEATGAIGPDLDELKPDYARVRKILVDGAGSMPSFASTLDEAEMDAVAAYVVHATGGSQ